MSPYTRIKAGAIDELIGMTAMQVRESQGYTRANLAVELGVSQQQVAKYENGQSPWKVGMLYTVAEFYGIEVIDLLPYPDDSELTEPTLPLAENGLNPRLRRRWARMIADIPADEQQAMLRFMDTMIEGFKTRDGGAGQRN